MSGLWNLMVKKLLVIEILKGYGGRMINTVFGYELLLTHVIEESAEQSGEYAEDLAAAMLQSLSALSLIPTRIISYPGFNKSFF